MKKLILALTRLFLTIPCTARTMKKIIIISLIFTFIQVSISNAIESNLVGWWKFDEGQSNIAYDSAGSNHGTIYGAAWTSGQIDGALDFDGDDGVYLEGSAGAGSPLNIYDSDLTISSWVKIRGTGGTIVARAKPNYITYRLGIDTNKAYINTYKPPTHWVLWGDEILDQDVWYHIVGVFDRNGDRGYVYVNGVEEANGVMTRDPSSNDAATKIGCRNDTTDTAFDGTIDDVRIYDCALSAEEILQLYLKGTIEKAFSPYPADGAAGVKPNVVLTWSPGKDAQSHDVYLGTDYNDVNNATPDSNEYKGNFDVNSYDPNGLELDTTYYWRIDEVNGLNVWKGNVWSFGIWPVIELSTEEFVFYALVSGANPDDQILSISNSGAGILNWEITYDCDWLTVNPVSGSSTGEPNEVILSVDMTGLDGGVYDCNLTISGPNAENSPQTVVVTLRTECFPIDHPDYDEWVKVGYPPCWCYPRQCHGDSDDTSEYIKGKGYYYCHFKDLSLLISAWNVREPPLGPGLKWPDPKICADFDHNLEYIKCGGYLQVHYNDLGILCGGSYRVHYRDLSFLLSYWNVREPPQGPGIPPDCLDVP